MYSMSESDESPEHKQPDFVSVLVPMRNEEANIAWCLQSILAQDYPRDRMEILVVDGMSEDRSPEIVAEFAARHSNIKLLRNPQRITPAALNIGLRRARGDIIIRVDGHTSLEPDYVRQCVRLLHETGASNVGGLMRSIGTDWISRAIALTMGSPLASGDSKFRYATEPAWVDTVYLGAFHRTVFEQVGLYNEELRANEDYELNYRIRRSGGAIFLSPAVKSWYRNRTTLRGLAQQYFNYGFWKVQMLRRHPGAIRWRQLAPPTLVVCLAGSALLGFRVPPLNDLSHLIAGSYLGYTAIFAVRTAAASGWRYLPILPLASISMHISWGLGFLWGLIQRSKVPAPVEPMASDPPESQ